MILLTEIFDNVQDFRRSAPGVDANLSFDELNASAESARKQILKVISITLWSKIILDKESDLCALLKNALANLTMYKDLVFQIVSTRNSGSSAEVYKHEVENMQRSYIDNYYSAMDSLLELIESDADFQNTATYSRRSTLRIKNAEELDNYYPIDQSYLFYARTTSFQREILVERLSDYYDQSDANEGRFTEKLNVILAKMIIAKALRVFDVIELPVTLRSLYKESKALRNGTSESAIVMQMADALDQQALDALKNIDLLLEDHSDDGSVDTETSFNEPCDKIYLL
ncbi:MAG: hypothetical protein PHY48_17750 [Candidatus Cloacimonetes bacterium]|nr:hypothetical protein [Candidatus Cloacimonadota bacterium]